ncbi:MAG: hypothetical protein G8237_02640 [Magnetococcales bacterium]|nr:hypothetical protein [Magnetococcales bacterium]
MKEAWLARFQEPSTWRGLVMLATAFGISMAPETMNNVVAIGTGLSGLIGVMTRDTTR